MDSQHASLSPNTFHALVLLRSNQPLLRRTFMFSWDDLKQAGIFRGDPILPFQTTEQKVEKAAARVERFPTFY